MYSKAKSLKFIFIKNVTDTQKKYITDTLRRKLKWRYLNIY